MEAMSVLTLEMNPAEAELLQTLGLLQELRSVFKFDLNIQVVHSPYKRGAVVEWLE